MKGYFIKQIKKSFKIILNLAIAFQLIVYPFVSTANNSHLTKREQKSLNQAEEFNKKHVESLRDFIFKPEEANQEVYRSHPLDSFGLLKQEVHYKPLKLSKQEKILEKMDSNLLKLSERAENTLSYLIDSLVFERSVFIPSSDSSNSENIKNTELEQLLNKLSKEGLTRQELNKLSADLESLNTETVELSQRNWIA